MQQSGATAFAIHAATPASEDDIPHIVVAEAASTTTATTIAATAVATIDLSEIQTGTISIYSLI
jgi:hypothetical protein